MNASNDFSARLAELSGILTQLREEVGRIYERDNLAIKLVVGGAGVLAALLVVMQYFTLDRANDLIAITEQRMNSTIARADERVELAEQRLEELLGRAVPETVRLYEPGQAVPEGTAKAYLSISGNKEWGLPKYSVRFQIFFAVEAVGANGKLLGMKYKSETDLFSRVRPYVLRHQVDALQSLLTDQQYYSVGGNDGIILPENVRLGINVSFSIAVASCEKALQLIQELEARNREHVISLEPVMENGSNYASRSFVLDVENFTTLSCDEIANSPWSAQN